MTLHHHRTAAAGHGAVAVAGAPEVSLLRLATAGSVDDGKSTLVGRLLHDCQAVLADQLAAVERVSRERGLPAADLALLTDGLRAEREQGITIDVAYRYFATPRRRFILADTPGHVQYTRNMVTGASTAELAVVLVDARNGVTEQTRRHVAVAALLRVPHMVLAVNKMDLVGGDEAVFTAIADECARYAARLGAPELVPIPISALRGDNVVTPSSEMSWYGGPTLLEHLEEVDVEEDPDTHPARFPVQYVLRPQHAGEFRDYRGYAGRLASGVLRRGDQVVVLPSGRQCAIAAIDRLGERDVDFALAPQSVTLRLTEDLDVSRGDLIVPAAAQPRLTRDVRATVCHLADRPLRAGTRVLLRHATSTTRAVVSSLDVRLDVTTLGVEAAPESLHANEIGVLTLRTASPLPMDDYRTNRRTGSFLLVDEADGSTLTAGMVGALDVGAARHGD
ncbi:sulfate adenylyltransferase subunit 1 [Kitasatospora sp. MAP12-15]|uniref:sulfate adenylyltransferase subunit 1 n=1 Tax=unclassified Kitasatospora TaxID=2633591 RepID=UPI002474F02B|nr:GTP-binding protein [Kitasatospora sp. MAP12-44]MDH6108453.1 sulfate adenylyltransferase subunit 1 [Kitasatospora sp. MAP12-44]